MSEFANYETIALGIFEHGGHRSQELGGHTANGKLCAHGGGQPGGVAGASFYLTGVRDANNNELMYFEIPLEKYLSAPET